MNTLKKIIEKEFRFLPNQNQYQQIERLIFEINQQGMGLPEILAYLNKAPEIKKREGPDKFEALKEMLLRIRYPLSFAHPEFKDKKVFLPKVKRPFKNNWQASDEFKPLKIIFEKKAKNSYLINNFKKKFPGLNSEEIPSLKTYLRQHKFKITELKKPLLFIVKEFYDFLKPCPCTKNHINCGYWIFNLGFGCPFDCSYCYLQQYSNTPGIILAANLKDFFSRFDAFEKKLKKPIRIGTGEFSDSLALDDITEYSLELIPYFRKKNVFFELKTKGENIQNILKEKPSSNLIISWSLNPEKIACSQEKSAASLEKRLKAAQKIQAAGFQIGFHLDPVIFYKNWQSDYQALIAELYSKLKPPFAWISLGTLRSNRKLKTIAEQRFPHSNIFSGELILGKDQKLRYPEFLRKKIYAQLLKSIREFDQKTPVYLCMESKEVWNAVSKKGKISIACLDGALPFSL